MGGDVNQVGHDALFALVERSVEGLGYELVDLQRAAGGLLRVTLDTQGSARAVVIADCERVSRHLTHLFAVENVDYGRLEVGSPGIDRPLKRRRDFARAVGAEIEVRLHQLVDGRRKLRGRLLGIDGEIGAERLQLALEPARLPGAGRAVARGARKIPARRGASVASNLADHGSASAPTVELLLADLAAARLVPDLNFRGTGGIVRGASK
jgi:ribosome maturation factor RimP